MENFYENQHECNPEIHDSGIARSALESAESYVAGCAGTSYSRNGGSKAFSSAFSALVEWGLSHSLVFPEKEFAFFAKATDGHGEEHEAWFDEASNRWFKATYPNRFGLAWGRDGTATAREYLSRLILQNTYFGDDIRLIGLVESNEHLRVLTSQPRIAGEPAEYDDIQSWFSGLNFVRLETSDRIAWYRKEENILIADAHEGNVIQTAKGDLVPIHLNIIQPTGELYEWVSSFKNC